MYIYIFLCRWGMNCNKVQLEYVNNIATFNKVLADTTKKVRDVIYHFLHLFYVSLTVIYFVLYILSFFKVKDIYLASPEVAAIHWEQKKDFIKQDSCTNVFIAAFTTSWARIKLYREMDKLGDAILYCDTDSIIYASNGTNDPPLGNYLGEFTDELDGATITSFVSGKFYYFNVKKKRKEIKDNTNFILFLLIYFHLF